MLIILYAKFCLALVAKIMYFSLIVQTSINNDITASQGAITLIIIKISFAWLFNY